MSEAPMSAMDTLFTEAFQARREHRLEDAKRDLTEAVGRCRAQLAYAFTRLGAIERDLGNRAVALKHYGEAVDIYRTEGDALLLAHSVRHLGDIHQEMHRADLAEPCYVEALDIYRGHAETPPLDLANTIRGFAMLKSVNKEDAGGREQAKALWTEARDLYADVTVDAGVEESSRWIAILA